jgi:hypothetical protein
LNLCTFSANFAPLPLLCTEGAKQRQRKWSLQSFDLTLFSQREKSVRLKLFIFNEKFSTESAKVEKSGWITNFLHKKFDILGPRPGLSSLKNLPRVNIFFRDENGHISVSDFFDGLQSGMEIN